MKYFVEKWQKITSDENILDIVQHCHIEFINNENPVNTKIPNCHFNSKEEEIIGLEIQKLLDMKVLKEVQHHPEEFLSPIFLRPKKDGEYRMILNLRKLNESIKFYHFKMDTFETALKLIKPNCYMASIDVRHAYYMVPIAEAQQIKLRFVFRNKVYQYVALPNGISCAPRQYTKLMKPVYATLRQLGHSNSGFIDDSLLVSDTFQECKHNISDTVQIMTEVGFIIHEKKSVLQPTQDITFLGNNIHSNNMTVTLPLGKVNLIVQECLSLYHKSDEVIRKVARVLGLIVSTFSAVQYGPLHYREIEREKIHALQLSMGDFNAIMPVTQSMKKELHWWINELPNQKREIDHGNADFSVSTDASLQGWGAVFQNQSIGGRWTEQESQKHINVLEMLAVSLGLKSFFSKKHNVHIQVRTDNTCTVAYINAMGGIKSVECNHLAVEIWSWCIDRNIWLSATHVPGVSNEADFSSRNFNENVEWMLNKQCFQKIVQLWQEPEIDMFASRLNKQVKKFASWKPDPDAVHVNAFSMSWSHLFLYAFPPFSLIPSCLQKFRRDKAEGIMVVPLWPTQTWYSELLKLLVDYPRILPQENLLTLVNSRKSHPLKDKLHLIACRLSGNVTKIETFQGKLQKSFLLPGESVLRNNMLLISKNGYHSVVKNKLIPFKQI